MSGEPFSYESIIEELNKENALLKAQLKEYECGFLFVKEALKTAQYEFDKLKKTIESCPQPVEYI